MSTLQGAIPSLVKAQIPFSKGLTVVDISNKGGSQKTVKLSQIKPDRILK